MRCQRSDNALVLYEDASSNKGKRSFPAERAEIREKLAKNHAPQSPGTARQNSILNPFSGLHVTQCLLGAFLSGGASALSVVTFL